MTARRGGEAAAQNGSLSSCTPDIPSLSILLLLYYYNLNPSHWAAPGLFYYAGHGIQVRGANYLVPVGANPTKEADVDFQMLDTNLVLRQMESAGTRLSLVILDACRNNPFGGRGLRSTDSGLAQMRAPQGTLISFATQPGNVALDGTDANSPYTKALAEVIRRPGLDIFQTFNEVGLAVSRTTGGAQQPWVSSSPISGSFYFAGLPATPSQARPPAGPDLCVEAAAHFGAAEAIGSKAAFEDHIARFPNCNFAGLARARLAAMIPPVPSATPPSSVQPAVGVFGSQSVDGRAGAGAQTEGDLQGVRHVPRDGGGPLGVVHHGLAGERAGAILQRRLAPGYAGAAVCRRQVRGDVRRMGSMRRRRRLQRLPAGQSRLGPRQAAGDQCQLGRRPGLCGVAVAQDRQDLSALE